MSADDRHPSSSYVLNSPSVHSSPSKRDYSVEIPTELWEELCELPRFSYWSLCASDYSDLSLTCKHFRDIFQKRLFRTVKHFPVRYVKEGQDGDNTEEVMPMYLVPRYYEQITRPPPPALKWTRDYTFCGMNELHSDNIFLTQHEKIEYEAAVISFARVLPKFMALRSLKLDRMDIGEELVAGIAGLSSLCSLDIDGCRLIYRAAPLDKQIVAKDLWFKSGGLEEERNLSPLQLFSNQRLASLMISMPSELSNILTHFADQGRSDRLRRLSLSNFDFEDFPIVFQFLATTPNLESLRFYENSPEDRWIPAEILDTLATTGPAAGLLRLREYTGPPELVPLLVPNTPVSSLHLGASPPWIAHNWEKGNRILGSISRSSSVKILVLPVLPPGLGLFPRISREFPNLEYLDLGLDDERDSHGWRWGTVKLGRIFQVIADSLTWMIQLYEGRLFPKSASDSTQNVFDISSMSTPETPHRHPNSDEITVPQLVHSLLPKPDYSVEIPTELWEKLCEPDYCHSLVLHESDYSNLSLTCRHFRDIFQRRIFRNVTHALSLYLTTEDGQSNRAAETTFCAKVLLFTAPPPPALKWTENYTFSGLERWGSIEDRLTEQEEAVYKAAVISLARNIANFTRLHTLELKAVKVDEGFVASIAGLSSLRSLYIGGPPFICRSVPRDKQIVVERLSIYTWASSEAERDTSPLQLFSRERLVSIRFSNLLELPDILTHFMSQGRSECLREIVVANFENFEDFPLLFSFLATAPNLEIVSFQSRASRDRWIPSQILDKLSVLLPPSGLSHLLEYEGPAELAPLLVPSAAALCSLNLQSLPWTGDNLEKENMILDSIPQCSSVKHLALPILSPRLQLFPKIVNKFPNIESLSLGLDDDACVSWEEENVDQVGSIPLIEVTGEGVPSSPAESFKASTIIMQTSSRSFLKGPFIFLGHSGKT
ncbi:hypothetical protein CVT26_013041 [Gymnopilus dilepis]|uniref:F-box domain-containing protein n=1 Tax=Gymnopilus dilepis TaxID=231916 RepID=A0A409Y4G4_9AGAR|nr:hypothetical protein CVT26_013041 [Gymnopilus dilepis]